MGGERVVEEEEVEEEEKEEDSSVSFPNREKSTNSKKEKARNKVLQAPISFSRRKGRSRIRICSQLNKSKHLIVIKRTDLQINYHELADLLRGRLLSQLLLLRSLSLSHLLLHRHSHRVVLVPHRVVLRLRHPAVLLPGSTRTAGALANLRRSFRLRSAASRISQ